MTTRLEAPQWYDDERRQIWDAAVARLTAGGRIFRADPSVLDTYCQAAADHADAVRLRTSSGGRVAVANDGKVTEHPLLEVQRRAARALRDASKALGLDRTPLDSATVEGPLSRADQRRWCEEHDRLECKHHRQNGGWCHSFAVIAGTGSCKKHSGLTSAAAKEKGRAALARLYASPLDVGPGDALLDQVRWSAGQTAGLRARVAELADQDGPDGEPGGGLWYGLVRETRRDGEVAEREYRAGPHAILAEYGREQDRLIKAASAAVSAGAQQEAVDIAKAVGAGLGRLLDAVFARMELSEYQRGLVPVVVPAVLREWDPAADDPAVLRRLRRVASKVVLPHASVVLPLAGGVAVPIDRHQYKPKAVRFPGELLAWLDKQAVAEGRPVNSVIVAALEQYRAAVEPDPAAKPARHRKPGPAPVECTRHVPPGAYCKTCDRIHKG